MAAHEELSDRVFVDLYWIPLGAGGWFVIEQAPVPATGTGPRGVVAEGPVGLRRAGGLRLFRYEVRCWGGGRIPDVAEAVESPRRLSTDSEVARRLLRLAPEVPTPVWGRDELGTGDMWNSNSVISWLVTRSGLDPAEIPLPVRGRAPGWDAGIVAARRGLVGPGLRPVAVGLRVLGTGGVVRGEPHAPAAGRRRLPERAGHHRR